ncbi:MAG: GNAT family N-acetyltransferase [Pseudomonadota bacterium]
MSDFSTTSPPLPAIETPRLRLRPRTMADFDACLALDREPNTVRHIDGPWDNPRAHKAFIRARIRGPYPPGLGYWVIARKANPGEFLGWVCLIPENALGPRTEIGWRVVGRARGQGFAPEAAANLLSHGFQSVGLKSVIAEINRDNSPSRRVAEKIGMRLWQDGSAEDAQLLIYGARIDCAI